MNKMFVSSSTGEFCASKAMWTIFGVICIIRFAIAGFTIGGVVMPPFDALAAAALFGVFTAGYAKREGDKAASKNIEEK